MASSQRQKRPIFIVFWILATLAIVALGLYFYRYQTLKTSLFGTKIQNLKIDGQTGNFELNNGDVYLNGRKESYLPRDFQVLALGNFYLSAKEDPLFASAGLNATEYSSTIDYLDKEQQTLMSSLHLTHDIIPIQFLKSIGDVKTASDTFYANPTSENAKSLLDQYQTSQKIYQESLDAFQKKFKLVIRATKIPPL